MRLITFATSINSLLQRKSNRTNMNILIIGGAGYIGSHMVKRLLATKHSVTILDNLSTGYRDAILGGVFIQGDVGNRALLDQIFSEHQFDAVLHFASFIQVGESVKKPELYYQNNLINTINLLNAMNLAGVKNFIFSSTAAIFGEPSYTPIDEIHPKLPINPYGRSKLMVEQILEDYDLAYGIKSVCLRYFNAAGADADGELGERHEPETHLIPILLQVASGRRERMSIFGNDYSTPDGTCIRDYIHVMDLCDAHIAALDYLQNDKESGRFNLGNGNGFSVAQVIEAVESVVGRALSIDYAERRPGDPAILVADATLARSTLEWYPKYSDLRTIVEHAWLFEQKYYD
jgi:UDP-glucose 4-epimerase